MIKRICVDMDYSSDPIWIDENFDDHWDNDSLSSYKNLLSNELLHSLKVYENLWEISNWSAYMSPSTFSNYPGVGLIENTLDILAQTIAVKIKKEQPTWQVYYTQSNSYHRIEAK